MRKNDPSGGLRQWLERFAPAAVRRRLLLLLAGQCVLYWGAKALTRSRFHHCLALPIDGKIPLLPWTVLIYFGCFAFWAFAYAVILREESARGKNRFFFAELTGKLLSALCFVILPTTLNRPEIRGSGLFPWLMRFLYAVDAPDALFPSLHCFVSWMCFVGLRGKPQISKAFKLTAALAAVLVFAATLTTKQHVFVDVLGGVALAELVWLASGAAERLLRRKGEKSSKETEKE